MRKGLPEARERSSLARKSSSRMISAEPLRSAVSCSSTERNVCCAVMDDGVALAALGAPSEGHVQVFLLICFGRGEHAAVFDAEFAGEDEANGFGVNAMLFGENARREGFFRIAGFDG